MQNDEKKSLVEEPPTYASFLYKTPHVDDTEDSCHEAVKLQLALTLSYSHEKVDESFLRIVFERIVFENNRPQHFFQ